MKIFVLSQSNFELESLVESFRNSIPGLELWVSKEQNRVHLREIVIPSELRRQGLGSEIVSKLKDFAAAVNKPLVLSPEAESGCKKKLENFYKRHELKWNKGRDKDYSISLPFAKTMYWRTSDG